ncbi:MAG: MarR family transcriptional regulator [Actinomycetota bacterium]|nr:MarR family transcriptional regulator [Euzebyaceae bacterium]MDQ3452612.1 MarR family transcriptional regulator [Actinomycetota bacterium]
MSDERWLNAEQQQAWRAFLATSALLHAALDRQLQREAGIPHAYYMVLAMLSESPGRALRMSQLAEATNSSQSRISHAVARLEEAGWVRREQCPHDRRGLVAVLTDAGLAVLAEAAPGHVRAVREHLFDQLSPEQVRQLEAICRAALRQLDPANTFPAVQATAVR